jgi:hypothetical protein
MSIRDKILLNAQHLCEPGEQVQAAIPAQARSPNWQGIPDVIPAFNSCYRVIVVTDRRILVCRSGRFRAFVVGDVLRELPRSTRIGPAHGVWYRSHSLGEGLYVHHHYFEDIASADAADTTEVPDLSS